MNLGCALVLAERRDHGGSLTRAAFLSARNDVLASRWWDLGVGFVIALMNADAARTVWRAARKEGRAIA